MRAELGIPRCHYHVAIIDDELKRVCNKWAPAGVCRVCGTKVMVRAGAGNGCNSLTKTWIGLD